MENKEMEESKLIKISKSKLVTRLEESWEDFGSYFILIIAIVAIMFSMYPEQIKDYFQNKVLIKYIISAVFLIGSFIVIVYAFFVNAISNIKFKKSTQYKPYHEYLKTQSYQSIIIKLAAVISLIIGINFLQGGPNFHLFCSMLQIALIAPTMFIVTNLYTKAMNDL